MGTWRPFHIPHYYYLSLFFAQMMNEERLLSGDARLQRDATRAGYCTTCPSPGGFRAVVSKRMHGRLPAHNDAAFARKGVTQRAMARMTSCNVSC